MNALKEKLNIIALLFTLLSISASPNPFLLIAVYGIHEIGHILFAKLTGAKIRKIRGRVAGFAISYDTEAISYTKEALVCSGGIIFNLITALCALGISKGNFNTFIVLNLSLALMNLYPVSILDGGGILKNLLLIKIREDVVEKICFCVSFVLAILMWLVSVYLQLIFMANVSLLLISVFLLIQLCFSI